MANSYVAKSFLRNEIFILRTVHTLSRDKSADIVLFSFFSTASSDYSLQVRTTSFLLYLLPPFNIMRNEEETGLVTVRPINYGIKVVSRASSPRLNDINSTAGDINLRGCRKNQERQSTFVCVVRAKLRNGS